MGYYSIKSGPSGKYLDYMSCKSFSENVSVLQRDNQETGKREMLPAAGNRNGTEFNNVGSNGNYWSSSLNTDNPNNAWNLNFNSTNGNMNNNNRNNGFSVRPVTEFTFRLPLSFDISPEQLLLDLYRAYKDARKHKRRKNYQLFFECNLEKELILLRNEIYSKRYKPQPSSCFIIHEPKMREIFAAQFRDRIVHHLLYNYLVPMLEPGFIEDSYSCIKGRGTHYGISRLERMISNISVNYSSPCYILKLDIEGYFMHINRRKLLDICMSSIEPFCHCPEYSLVSYLLEVIVLDNPVCNCQYIGQISEWQYLPKSKSLFCSPKDCGLPIGNLTSQLFSNIYMNYFDKKMEAILGGGRYGRYVDDMYVVGSNTAELRKIIVKSSSILSELGLNLNRNKIAIYSAYRGVEFLGAFLKPFRKYLSNHTLMRIRSKISVIKSYPQQKRFNSINSYLGLTSHFKAFNIRKKWIEESLQFAYKEGFFTRGLLKYRLKDVKYSL